VTDEQLWISSKKADEREAFWEAIFVEQLPRVYNYFRYRVGDKQTAEDLTSATFERAWHYRERYRQDVGAFSAWLFTIAHNVANDHFRRSRVDVSLDDVRDVPAEELTEEAVQRQTDLSQLKNLLAGLKPVEHELMALKYGAGLTNREIAKLVGLTETNTGSILHRVVDKLKAHWKE